MLVLINMILTYTDTTLQMISLLTMAVERSHCVHTLSTTHPCPALINI